MSKVGIVKHWNDERGFGHIGQEGVKDDIFVHRTCLVGANSLAVNDQVFYDAIYDSRKKKYQAITVKSARGVPPQQAAPGHFQPVQAHAYQQPVAVHNPMLQHSHSMQQSPAMMQSPSTQSPMIHGGVQQVQPHGYGSYAYQQPNQFVRQDTPAPGHYHAVSGHYAA